MEMPFPMPVSSSALLLLATLLLSGFIPRPSSFGLGSVTSPAGSRLGRNLVLDAASGLELNS
jgi:hypothetical protein